eukprot:767955-Hanusia_phi.AAC.4
MNFHEFAKVKNKYLHIFHFICTSPPPFTHYPGVHIPPSLYPTPAFPAFPPSLHAEKQPQMMVNQNDMSANDGRPELISGQARSCHRVRPGRAAGHGSHTAWLAASECVARAVEPGGMNGPSEPD